MKKKANIKTVEHPKRKIGKDTAMDSDDKARQLSIEEFIKIRKLQNQILEKMLEKISKKDSEIKIEKAKNK